MIKKGQVYIEPRQEESGPSFIFTIVQPLHFGMYLVKSNIDGHVEVHEDYIKACKHIKTKENQS